MIRNNTTQLAPNFQFSQSSLQDYVECKRRFQLRYIERVAWPAVQAQPILEHEARLANGQAFHRLVQQQLLGIPETRLTPVDDDLRRWWQAYLETRPADIEGRRYIEIALAATIADQRLVAQYDLVVITPQSAQIFDWKTSTHPEKPETTRRLFERMQTRVYRYLLVRAGADLNDGQSIAPEQVTMTYWFAETPEEPVHFAYNADQFAADERVLTSLITEIQMQELNSPWELTTQERTCAFCPYRSLCERGVEAGETQAGDEVEIELSTPGILDLDLDQIAEIPF
ncbi:MAG: PD-(D/E)XK nuclease family protein [Anaerolineae bacterium]|nr:PD-(D/E)XK nuclease family protein [Anaerolineae bacterium]